LSPFAGTGFDRPLKPLNSRQEQCLRQYRPGSVLGIREYRTQFAPRVSERQARRDLAELEKAAYLEKRGSGPRTGYLRTPRRP
jgi:hypothetical protein